MPSAYADALSNIATSRVRTPDILAGAARRDYGRDRTGRRRRSRSIVEGFGPLDDAALPVGPLRRRTGNVVRHRLEREVVQRDQHDLGRARGELRHRAD